MSAPFARFLSLLRLLLAAVFSASAAFAFAVASCREMDLIDLTGDDDEQARPQPAPKSHKRARKPPADDDEVVIVDSPPARSGPAKPAKPPKEELPPWQGLQGTKRVLSEFRHLSRACAARTAPCYDLVMPQEAHSNVWRFKLKEFDQDHPGGAALNADLRRLHAEHGVDHLLCEVIFPSSYPQKPFLLRLVYPRCCWYTGHVTAGGSICIEALTQTGSANAWRPDFCVSGLLPLVKHNLIDVDAVQVRTATGPGGLAGPLRIDFGRQWHQCPTPLVEYSKQEAEAAFARTEAHHAKNGW